MNLIFGPNLEKQSRAFYKQAENKILRLMRLRLQAEQAQPKNQQQNNFFLPRFEKNIFFRIFEIIVGVTLYQIVGKYVSFFSFCRMATARKPRKAVFQSKRKRRLYV